VKSREYDLLERNQIDLLPMKILSALIAIGMAGFAAGASAAESPKESDRDPQQIVALTKEVQTQQTAIADNQKKIDEKLASISEAVRLAKIYAARGR
jgi:hypothetical protein